MQGDVDDALTTLQVTREIQKSLGEFPSKMRKDTCDVLVMVASGTLELQSDAQRQYL